MTENEQSGKKPFFDQLNEALQALKGKVNDIAGQVEETAKKEFEELQNNDQYKDLVAKSEKAIQDLKVKATEIAGQAEEKIRTEAEELKQNEQLKEAIQKTEEVIQQAK